MSTPSTRHRTLPIALLILFLQFAVGPGRLAGGLTHETAAVASAHQAVAEWIAPSAFSLRPTIADYPATSAPQTTNPAPRASPGELFAHILQLHSQVALQCLRNTAPSQFHSPGRFTATRLHNRQLHGSSEDPLLIIG